MQINNIVDILSINLDVNKIKGYIQFYYNILIADFNKYDVIYINHWAQLFLPLIVKRLNCKNVVVNFHGSDLLSNSKLKNILNKFANRIIPKSAKIIVPSRYYKELVEKNNIKNEVYIVPSGGVDAKIFNEYGKKKYQSNKIIMGFASGLVEDKGYRLLLECINKLKNNNYGNKVLFYIIDYGKDKEKVHEYVKKNKLENLIMFKETYKKEEMSEFYKSIDFLIFPTKRESLGLVALESMACGTPVIATNAFAIPEYIIDDINGFLFTKGNVNELYNAVIKACSENYERYISIKENATNVVLNGYTREKCIDKFNLVISSFY